MEWLSQLNSTINSTVSIIVILNPISAGAVMLSLLGKEANKESINRISYKASLAILVAMLLTFFIGNVLIRFFGISIFSIEIIGGAVLFLMAINMINGDKKLVNHSAVENEQAREKEDISVIPLAIPILFGPGMIATMIAIKAKAVSWEADLSTIIAILLSAIITFIILKNMTYINRYLGISGVKIISRVMGLVVGALAAQFMLNGIKSLWKL